MPNTFAKAATHLLESACTPNGIMASAEGTENYNRIWARDSAIAGIAGLIAENEMVSESFRVSLLNLAKSQHEKGQIPSNISFNEKNELIKVSYGGLAGRVDATTWWTVGCGLYYLATKDENFKHEIEKNVEKAFEILEAWEFNGRGLVYVPLSGNWADEYVTQGYNLYDQLLRMWGMKLAANIWNRNDWHEKAENIKILIEKNYWLNEKRQENELFYHPIAMEKAKNIPYWACSFAPNGYDTRFDLAANALAILLMPKGNTLKSISNYLSQLAQVQNHWLIPIFLPIIKEEDADWQLLSQNYAYRFKNYPHHFHNGGVWGVFLGFMGMALAMSGEKEITEKIYSDWIENLKKQENPYDFYEYFASDTLKAGGMPKLCFTAAGTIFMYYSLYSDKMSKFKAWFSPFEI